MGIELYSATADNNTEAAPDGWPEGMNASDVNNSARQNMADTRAGFNDLEWFEYRDATPDGVVTFVANNQFKIVSPTNADVTGHWHVGRRVRIVDVSPLTTYATITATSFSTDTTTVTIDSTALTNVDLVASSSIISAVNSPISLIDGDLTVEGDFDVEGAFTSLGIDDNGTSLAISINSSESVFFGGISTAPSASVFGASFTNVGTGTVLNQATDTTANRAMQVFINPNGTVGTINTNGTATAYITSSDPRLKTDLKNIVGADAYALIEQAHDEKIIGKFAFKTDLNIEVWGYNAHKVIDLQAGFGGFEGEGSRNDELGGDVTPAGIDQSKRVPILEAAIYELIQEVKTLKNT